MIAGVAGRTSIDVPHPLVHGFVYIFAELGCCARYLGLASLGWYALIKLLFVYCFKHLPRASFLSFLKSEIVSSSLLQLFVNAEKGSDLEKLGPSQRYRK